MLAAGRPDQLAEFVFETLAGEVAFLVGDPFLQPEVRRDDEFCHGCVPFDFLLDLLFLSAFPGGSADAADNR